MDNVHERVWEKTPDRNPRGNGFGASMQSGKPVATYGLLITIGIVYVLEIITDLNRPEWFSTLWVIDGEWWREPWTLVTSTFAHGSTSHLLFNGLMLFFFGRALEQMIGPRMLVLLFILSGAVAGVLQVELTRAVYGATNGALGASGALMMIFGALVIVIPKAQIYIMGIVPVPFWIAAIGYAAIDILGALNPGNGIGNFAHLSGMAIGLYVGTRLRAKFQEQGVQFRSG